jgi:predicted transposase/invertase (TIGR01784 family)
LQGKLLDPKLDLVFKKLFSMPENRQALLRFLNLIFADRRLPLIQDLEIINPQLDGDLVHEKSIVLDIHAQTPKGERINIVIQLRNHLGLRERALFYWSRSFNSQLQSGEEYSRLQRTVSIFLLDFRLMDHDDLHSVYQLLEQERHDPFTDRLEIHLIELPKLASARKTRSAGSAGNTGNTGSAGVADKLDNQPLLNWLTFLRGAPQAEWERLAADETELRKVMSTLISISKDLELWAIAESRTKAMFDHNTFVKEAFDEGKAEGKAEGKIEGFAEKNRETAIALLNEGIAEEVICRVTGYSAKQLAQFALLKSEK